MTPTSKQPKVKKYYIQKQYKTNAGKVDIVVRHIFPSYEFIYASIPKDHKLYGTEVCFFAWNDSRADRSGTGFYIDKDELDIMIDGFTKVREAL
jgi:hypothetical protein